MKYFSKKDIDKSLLEYEETRKYFLDNFVSADEINLIEDIKNTKKNLSLLLKSDGAGDLILIREKLNRCLEALSNFIYEHSEKSDWVYIWRKNKMASEWTPLKEKFKKTADAEKYLEDKYSKERIYSMFEQKRTDYLLNLVTSIQNDLRTIQLKIEDIARERINIGREEKRYEKKSLF